MSGIQLDQSIPICSALAAFGGILEVFATAILAYPAAKSAEGKPWTDAQLNGALVGNIFFQILASLSGNLFATWFGPVAIVGPIFFAAQLLANLVVFWVVLGLEAFSREMQIGTYVIVVAVVMLIVNGPGAQDYGDTTFDDLITESYALIWACLLLGALLATGVILMVVDLRSKQTWFKISVLLIARASGFSLNLSTGKALILPINTFWLTITIIIKILSGIIYTKAIVVQSTAVEQRVFVPLNAATIIFVNAMTGIIIWEDWRAMNSWYGYGCVFLLLALGCGLLLGDLNLLQETSPETFMGARVAMVRRDNRQEMLHRLRDYGKIDVEQLISDSQHSRSAEIEVAAATMNDTENAYGGDSAFVTPPSTTTTRNRRAWLSVYENSGAHTSARMEMSHRVLVHTSQPSLPRWQSLQRVIKEEDAAAMSSDGTLREESILPSPSPSLEPKTDETSLERRMNQPLQNSFTERDQANTQIHSSLEGSVHDGSDT